jgi:hypothetical protein
VDRHDHVIGLKPPALAGPAGQRILAAACGILGLCSVAPLLAWVYDLGTFAAWFWLLAAPGILFISVTAIVLKLTGRYPTLYMALVAGVLGGIVATIGYDLIRTPFLAVGYRLFAPINSYGVLGMNATHSSHATDTVGWLYNFANGVGFGVGYAVIALGRRWWWAIPWALGLETMTIVTPYADVYNLRNQLDIIAIAYGAHVAYGVPLGIIVQQAGRWQSAREAFIPPSWAIGGVLVGILLWQQPWVAPEAPPDDNGRPVATVSGLRFVPEWVRLPVGGCLVLDNHDDIVYTPSAPPAAEALLPNGRATYCFPTSGIKRVQLNGVPYSGGFVLVDPAL